ncbi:MAG: tyrosine-type recombinase/integrase [Actinomycetota bacterium]|nr:tyrosine-type recombinase/integrase [Actinomycetota bacterium]
MEFWAQRTISPLDRRERWTVVDERYVEHARAGEWLRVLLDGEGRSVGTAHTYAGRIALYLTWATATGVDPLAPAVEQLAAFARWLERTPSRKHRPGRDRRLAPRPGVVTMTAARSPATVDGILIAAVEFVRFAASRGWTEPAAAEALSVRERLRFLPARWDRGERTGAPVVQRRRVRRRRVELAPATLQREEVALLVDACSNVRDRFIVEALYATGLRAAELCGLRLEDMHLIPSATHLGCAVAGPHLHAIRREDNENGALAKSVFPRVVPVTKDLVWLHDAYRAERDVVAEAAVSNYLLVNLWRAPLGRALSPNSLEELFVRLSAKVGFRAHPHMLRHSFASEVALLTKDPALVKELLGHASVTSTDVYLHSRWNDMRAAAEAHVRANGSQR